MTGPEHYRRAEDYMASAEQFREVPVVCSFHLKMAALHAELATAAATALGNLPDLTVFGGKPPAEEWREVIS